MIKKNRSFIFVMVCLLSTGLMFGQKAERKNVREGNKLYKNKKYTEAEIAYRKSLEVNPRSKEGCYNLGNALYKQGKFPEAAKQYQIAAAQEKDPARLANVYHNLGNISMKGKQYDKSVLAYKQSLRLNPKDDETRYNLALAQKLLQNQQNQDKSQQQQNKNQKDDQKNKEDQQKNQQQQQDDKKQNKTEEKQQQNEQMSKDNAQQMLDAFLQDEKNTQEKVKKAQQQQHQRRKTEKEW